MSKSSLATGSPVSHQTWSEVFAKDTSATPFQSPQWMSAITGSGHFLDASRVYSMPGGHVVLPLLATGLMGVSLSAASMAHGLGAGGLVADFPLTVQMVREIVADLGALPYLRLSIRPNALQADLWEQAVPPTWTTVKRKTHILDLDGGFDTVWSERIASAKRNKVRKAERAGMVVEQGNTPDLVRRFYDLYLLWSENRARDRRLPPALIRWVAERREPFWKFQAAAEGMKDQLRIYIASHEGQAVAGAVYLQAGSAAIHWRGASDARLLAKLPGNDLLQSVMIRQACDAGCTHYHMGESGGVDSLERFKEEFGAKPHHYAEFVRERLPITTARRSVQRALDSAAALMSRRGGTAAG